MGSKEERDRQGGGEERELGEREKKRKEEDCNIVAMECMACTNNTMARYRWSYNVEIFDCICKG